jgi:hypothetical protein
VKRACELCGAEPALALQLRGVEVLGVKRACMKCIRERRPAPPVPTVEETMARAAPVLRRLRDA